MVCLDATFLVDLLRGDEKATALTKDWRDANESVSIPAPALVEVASGAAMEHSGKAARVVESLARELMVLPLNKEAALCAGRINAELILVGEMIGLVDVMIAAITMEHSEVLVTRNLRHFERIAGLELEGY